MSKYKFVKVKINNYMEFPNWYFLPESIEQVEEHWNEIASKFVKTRSIQWERSDMIPIRWLLPNVMLSEDLDNEYINQKFDEQEIQKLKDERLKSFENKDSINLLSDTLTLLTFNKDIITFTDEVIKDKLEYPTVND